MGDYFEFIEWWADLIEMQNSLYCSVLENRIRKYNDKYIDAK